MHKNNDQNTNILIGIPASSGIEIAKVCKLTPNLIEDIKNEPISQSQEIFKLDAAFGRLGYELVLTKNELEQNGISEAEIFNAMAMILQDPSFRSSIIADIEKNNQSAYNAVITYCNSLAGVFAGFNDITMKSKAEDIQSLRDKICFYLTDTQESQIDYKGKIIVANIISPIDSAKYAKNGALGFVTKTGGVNSHTAIVARSFGIPMVCGLDEIDDIPENLIVAIDGFKGEVLINPDTAVLSHYGERKKVIDEHKRIAYEMRSLPTQTLDEVKITLCANIDTLEDIDFAIANGAEEVGLLRTEYLLLGRGEPISADEQYEYYEKIAERAYPMPVTLRVFDIGGDKIPAKNFGADDSPLGMRGIRLLFHKEQMLHDQLEAILRASSIKNLRIMIPMVTSDEQIWKVKAIIKKIRQELQANGVSVDKFIPGGAMIETPSAALVADSLAFESDFLSIGTNDLTQYTLAVDRNDEDLAEYYDELHPAVLKLIKMTTDAGSKANIPVSLCGELAGNLSATEILIGLGVKKFSVSPVIIPQLKMKIREINAKAAQELASKALLCSDGIGVRKLLNN